MTWILKSLFGTTVKPGLFLCLRNIKVASFGHLGLISMRTLGTLIKLFFSPVNLSCINFIISLTTRWVEVENFPLPDKIKYNGIRKHQGQSLRGSPGDSMLKSLPAN